LKSDILRFHNGLFGGLDWLLAAGCEGVDPEAVGLLVSVGSAICSDAGLVGACDISACCLELLRLCRGDVWLPTWLLAETGEAIPEFPLRLVAVGIVSAFGSSMIGLFLMTPGGYICPISVRVS